MPILSAATGGTTYNMGGKMTEDEYINATPDEAEMALQTGAAAIVVSNHGGRQLDGTVSSIRALPEVVDAVGGRAEVYFDDVVVAQVGGDNFGDDAVLS